MHGALSPGKTVVYLLDTSGSMGTGGKFDIARAALVSTLRQQPATVRFQVIVYAGNATPLLTSDWKGLPASEANVRAAAEKLAALEPRGQSDHFGAVRAALRFRPDVILFLSDGDDISPVLVKKVVASAGRTVPVCLGRVTDLGVQRPYELK
jgi:Mg-chelatase subunit ChlD